MKACLLSILLLVAWNALAASRGILLTWDHNPPSEQVTEYLIYAALQTNMPPVMVTNWSAGPTNKLTLFWADKTGPEQPQVTMHWASTNHPALLAFYATALNAYGESAYSEPAVLAWVPTAPGLRIIELSDATEQITIGWTNLPPSFVIQSSQDLVSWKTLFSAHVGVDYFQDLPWRIDWIQKTTNRPAQFWRRLNL